MKKSHITLLSILLVIIVFISVIFFLKDRNNDQSKADSMEEKVEWASGENQDKTISHENGDFIYSPANEEIGYDNEQGIFFYENLLNVFLVSEISNEQATDLANIVNGELVGEIQGSINMLQIQVEEKSLNELNKLVDRLMKEELVKFADSSTPSFISDLNDDVEKASEKDDEVNPEGNNWWAEAINAYPAWDYMDKHKNEFEPVTVTVLETGKLGKEDDIADDSINKDSVTVSKSSAKDAIYKTMGKSDLSHAELVTKIIAADKNPQTIRGVAEPITEIEFISIGNPESKEAILENLENYNIRNVGEAEIIANIKSSDQDDELTIINNSWGLPPLSKEEWNKEEYLFKGFFQDVATKDKAYDEYLKTHRKSNDKISVQMIIALDLFLQSGKGDEFLIVQAAGNDASFEAKDSGSFANINEKTHDEASHSIQGKLESSLEDILNHIVIVGGAVQTDDKTAYKAPDWASYGDAIDIAAPADDLFIGSFQGTSFATPMVSGAVAMIWSYNPEMKASEVKDLLLESAEYKVEDKKEDKTYSYPMLNMTAFLAGQSFYNDLIETYRTAISEQWELEKLNEKGLGSLNDHPDASLANNYGYEFRDINGNGLPELVLGIYREDGSAEIHEIYTLQDKIPVKVFANGIRTNINIYKDGTISATYGIKLMAYYKLNNDGTEELEEGYEMNSVGKYESSIDPYELMTDGDIEAVHEKYDEIGIIEHSFTPFVSEEEKTDEVVEKSEKELALSNDEMADIMRENYKKLEKVLLEADNITKLYDKHHKIEDGQQIWESGVEPNSPFYKAMYDLLYPKVKHLVAEEGMESLINLKYSMFWQPPATITFYGPDYDLEVLEKDSGHFKLKQTKEIPPHEKGGDFYDLIYFVKYVIEDGEWKFAGAKKQE